MQQGLEEEEEKNADPYADDHMINLNKYSWGCNEKGQLGMPYINNRKRKTGTMKPAPEKIP